MSPLFMITRYTVDKGIARLAVAGQLDPDTSPYLDALIADAFAVDHVSELILDLRDVACVQPAGVRALVAGCAHAHEHGGTLRVDRARDSVQRALLDAQLVRFSRSG